ncbi:MAG: hypothetical protein LUD02_03670 [Tannerellaceae bacterium]|nr:hypothetical protein [Tannerellaceae bacterium]MCD8263358.1 hypothetical protein [Tannerellaceae bacterium]
MDIETVNRNSQGDGLLTLLTGEAPLVAYTPGSTGWTGENKPAEGTLCASILLIPVNTRIELAKMTYTGVLSFEAEGIYMDHFYTRSQVNLENKTGLVQYTPDGYDSTLSTMYDLLDLEMMPGTSLSNEDKVWAYHVFGSTAADEYKVVRLIIRLTHVTNSEDAPLDDRYLVIKGFTAKNSVTGAIEKVNSLDAGYLYRISHLTFDDSNLVTDPDTGEGDDVMVEVRVMDWKTIDVSPII